MRILVVSPYPPAHDGIGAYAQHVIAALRAAGHQALVIVPRAHGPQPGEVIGTLGSARPGRSSLHETAMAWQPDIIHVQFGFAAFGAQSRALLRWLRLMRAAGVPVVATLHEVTRDIALLRGPGRALYRVLARECDHVIVHTRAAFAVLTGRVGVPEPKVSVIPHPEVAPPPGSCLPGDLRARFGLADAELLVAFGFIHVDKGLGDLVRALGLLRRNGLPALDGVRLVIAGAVRPRHGLLRLSGLRDRCHLARVLWMARRAGLHGTIVRTGYVPEAEVATWFQAAAAIVLPYRRIEQSGVAALANAFGVPVLASTAGGLGEQYACSGWTFPPRDPHRLASVLARFLATPPAGRAVTADQRRPADLSSVISATADVYQAVARRGNVACATGSRPHAA